MRKIDSESFLSILRRRKRSYLKNYYAMYNSLVGGIVTDPAFMLIPVDDHVAHRGDGIFETFKCVSGNIYNLRAHMDRLEHSARVLHFRMKWTIKQICRIVVATVSAGGHGDCLVRVLISRGPGSFDVNPCDCDGPQLYVTASRLKRPFMELHPEGAVVRTSAQPAKPPFYAGVKSCNYLPNVLMKKEAVDQGADFMAAFDENGFLAEGATENIGIVSRAGDLLFPKLDGILCGTTMMRVMELARRLIADGDVRKVWFSNISKKDMRRAAEIIVVGTSPNVVAVREFDGRRVGSGRPGPVARKLNALLVDDILCNTRLQTRVRF